MIKKIQTRLRQALALLRYFKNWRELVLLFLKRKNPKRIILRNGIVIETPEDRTLLHITKEIFVEHVYTPIGSNLSIGANDVVVDIGANIGIFTLYAATKTQNKIYAFEPFPGNYEFLLRNIATNGLRNVTTDCLAVSDKRGVKKLYLSKKSGGQMLFDHRIDGRPFIEVPTQTLAGIMKERSMNEIDFLKMDCEGSEGQILASTPSDCLQRIRAIAMEFHDNVSILKHEDIQRLLEHHGFSCRLDWDGVSPFGYLYAARN